MQLFMVCTQDDIDEIVKEFNLSITEKLKLKCAVNKLLEVKTDKLQIIDPSESNAMSKMQDKIIKFENCINDINLINISINEQNQICDKLINEIFNKIEIKLNKRKQEIKDKLSRMIHIKHKILLTQKENVNKNLKIANKIKKECHRLLSPTTNNNNNDNNDDDDDKNRKYIILNKQKEIEQLEICNNGKPKISPYLIFDFESDYKHLLHTISKFGNIINGDNGDNGDNKDNNNNDENNDEWDIKIYGDNIKIINNDRVICNEIQSYCYRSVFGKNIYNLGKHHWKLEIKQCNDGYCAWNMLIGCMKIDEKNKNKNKIFHRNSHFTSSDHGYGFIGNLSYLTNPKDGGHGTDRKYGKKFINIGDIIDIYLDLDELSLSYKINNIPYGIAFDNLQKTKYCLAVTFCGNKNELKMLKYDHQSYK